MEPAPATGNESPAADDDVGDIFGEEDDARAELFVERFAWLRKENSSHASPSYSDTEARRTAALAQISNLCRERVHRTLIAPAAARLGSADGIPDAAVRVDAIARLDAISSMITASMEGMRETLSKLGADGTALKPDTPFSAANLIALIDAGHFIPGRYNDEDRKLFTRLRDSMDDWTIPVNEHPALRVRVMQTDGRTGMPIPVMGEDGKDVYEFIGNRLGLSAQLLNDIGMYVYLADLMSVCERWEELVRELLLSIEAAAADVDDVHYTIDLLAVHLSQTFGVIPGIDEWDARAKERDDYNRAAQTRTERGRKSLYKMVSESINEICERKEEEWDSGKQLRHLRWQEIGLLNTDGRLDALRRRVENRFNYMLAVVDQRAAFMAEFIQALDATGHFDATGDTASMLTIEYWDGQESSGIEWNGVNADLLWCIDATLDVLTGVEYGPEIDDDGNDPFEDASTGATHAGLRTRLKNALAKLLGEGTAYDHEKVVRLRGQNALANRKLVSANEALERGDFEESDDFYDEYLDLTPWLDHDRKKIRDRREARAKTRQGEKLKANLKTTLYGMAYSAQLELWYDAETGERIGREDSTEYRDEVARRKAGIPHKYWTDGIFAMSPGDRRRAEYGGYLLPRPTEPAEYQDEDGFLADLAEWDATFKFIQEENARLAQKAKDEADRKEQLAMKRKRDEDWVAKWKGFAINVYDKRRGYIKVTSSKEHHEVHQRMIREDREEAQRNADAYFASEEYKRRRQEAEDQAEQYRAEAAYSYRLDLAQREDARDRAEAQRLHGAQFGRGVYSGGAPSKAQRIPAPARPRAPPPQPPTPASPMSETESEEEEPVLSFADERSPR